MAHFKWFIERFFRRTPAVETVVAAVFPERDRAFAETFYKRWSAQEYLLVQLGDGYEGLSPDSFFESAWFYFIWPPIRDGDGAIIGIHAEDEMATLQVNCDFGAIGYEYDKSWVKLAEGLPQFVQSLRDAGWTDE
jgi:hypothetical protein